MTLPMLKQAADAARAVAKAWCALADRLEQSSSTESDAQLDRDLILPIEQQKFTERHVEQQHRQPRM
jgi:hypothetical protein